MPVDSKWIRNVPKERWPSLYDCGYFNICTRRNKEEFFDALSYQAKDDDLFISTYPKNGTTWTQQIIYLIQHDAESPATGEQFGASSVYLEQRGRKAAESIVKPGCIKTHVSPILAPWNEKAKYIIVIRNPKDVAVSYYYHTRGKIHFKFENGSFDDFFDLFIAGLVEYGDYFEFIHAWSAKRHLPNVLILTYECMKADVAEAIRRIAHFIDAEKYGSKVDSDSHFVDRIISQSSFDFMKQKYSEDFAARSTEDFHFFRKGVVNDWKCMLSEEQNERITLRFKEEAKKNPFLMDLWQDYSWLNDTLNKSDTQ